MESAVIRFSRALACAEMIDDEGRRAAELAWARQSLAQAQRQQRQRDRLQAAAIESNSRAMVATLAANWTGRDLASPALIEFDWHVRCPLAQAVMAGALERLDGLVVGGGLALSTFELTALGRLLVRRWRRQAGDVA